MADRFTGSLLRIASDHPGQRAFTSAQDLLRIKGFGYAIITQLQPYLIFTEPKPAATQSITR